jgi:uncharacterized membrane protein YkvA (DUF1232 family)
VLDDLKRWSRLLRRDVHAIYLAAYDPRVPWYAKVLAFAVAAYALSPVDLIPDFIPVLGYLDDLIIVPLGIVVVVRMIPADVLVEYRALASAAQDRPVSWIGAIAVVAVWVLAIGLALWLTCHYLSASDQPRAAGREPVATRIVAGVPTGPLRILR